MVQYWLNQLSYETNFALDTIERNNQEARLRILTCQFEQGLTLEPGDMLEIGTAPDAVYAMGPPNFLKTGDKITSEVEGIGQLANIVRESDSSVFAE